MSNATRVSGLFVALAVALAIAPAAAQAPAPVIREGKPGGVLRPVLREDLPQGFAIHESATNSVTWPAMPCYSNLVIYDQTKRLGRMETIVPELAEKWSWQDNYRNLVFFLRRDVKWHDGQPFTSKDVKFTFDVVREAPDAPAKLRINPRKEWYANVDAIEAPDPYTVVFRLKRPQPSLVAMLASGYSPVLPAHVPLAEHRSRCIGTGPFKFKEWKRGQSVELVRNPDYFVKGRPYLDGVRYTVIVERGTRVAALQAGQIDVAYPGETTLSIAEQLKKAVPGMVLTETASNVSENLLLNTKKPPFDNVKVRRALSFAIDRRTYTQTVHRGAAVIGASLAPKPWGVWGLLDRDLSQLPGYGGAAAGRAQAKKLLAEAGFGPSSPLKVELVTRAIAIYLDFAGFVVSDLKQVGVEATLKQIDTAQWHPMVTRREFQIGANLTGLGVDDPDANFYENFSCGSPRNYGDYCNEEVGRLIEQQSQETDLPKRVALVAQIQKKLEEDAARPTMGWRTDRFAHYPSVKNLILNQVTYNCCRLQEVWLDK
ncbi:MAG TPA: ABC transporter substrate-binding protein [Verrucomicrobiae bacterium]|jgi:peptide/nickel transport system substrate-binding protein|nr:ABC transporter substrate-binding protein [Verrucomicrobiae bacterium]